MTNIGIWGLGSMGLGMAQSLVKAGLPTVGHDPRGVVLDGAADLRPGISISLLSLSLTPRRPKASSTQSCQACRPVPSSWPAPRCHPHSRATWQAVARPGKSSTSTRPYPVARPVLHRAI